MGDDWRQTPDTTSGNAQAPDPNEAYEPAETDWAEADTLSRLAKIAKHDTTADAIATANTIPLDRGALTERTTPPFLNHTSDPIEMTVTPMASSPVADEAYEASDAYHSDTIPDDAAPTEAALPTPGEALRLPPWRRGPVERPGGRQAPSYSYGSLGQRKGGPNRLARASAHAEATNRRVWRPRLIFVVCAGLGVVGLVVAIILASVVTLEANGLFAPATASPGTNTLFIPTTPPNQRTPRAKGSVAPGSGFLTASPAAAPHAANLTNLTTATNSDWAHWGLTAPGDFNHKASGGGQIGNYRVTGGATPQQLTGGAVAYSWSDGQPTPSITDSTTGVYIVGAGDGLSFSVPASTSARTLTVYVSAYHAQGVFTASLTDNSAAPYTDTTVSGVTGAVTGVYTITFQAASSGHHLVISFTDQTDYQTDGYVSLQAATLN